jgi:hypothetical protein
MSDNEHEKIVLEGDAATVKAESARRTRRSFLVGGMAAAAGYGAWRAIDQSRSIGRLQAAFRHTLNCGADGVR